MRTGLCIGGPIDGEVRTAHGSELMVPLRIPVNSAAYLMAKPDERVFAEVTHKIARYRYESFGFNLGEPIGMWVSSELTTRDALSQVFQAYANAAVDAKKRNRFDRYSDED